VPGHQKRVISVVTTGGKGSEEKRNVQEEREESYRAVKHPSALVHLELTRTKELPILCTPIEVAASQFLPRSYTTVTQSYSKKMRKRIFQFSADAAIKASTCGQAHGSGRTHRPTQACSVIGFDLKLQHGITCM